MGRQLQQQIIGQGAVGVWGVFVVGLVWCVCLAGLLARERGGLPIRICRSWGFYRRDSVKPHLVLAG